MPLEPARYLGGDYRESRVLEQVHVVLGFEGEACGGAHVYTQSVLATLLGGGMSSRLFQEVRERRGLVYTIFSFASAYSDAGLFGIYAGTGENDLSELIPVVCHEIARTGGDLTEEEVERARAQLRASVLMAQESTATRCEQLAHQILVYGRPLSNSEILEKIAAVDVTAVRQMLDGLLNSKPTMAVIGPLGALEDYEGIQRRFTRIAA
jgi:predicted Zn-dependent peptidase